MRYSARNAWFYNYSRQALERNIASMIGFYNSNVDTMLSVRKESSGCSGEAVIQLDPTKISWTRGLRNDFEKCRKHPFQPECIRMAIYRPFVKQHYYFDRAFNDHGVSDSPSLPDASKQEFGNLRFGRGNYTIRTRQARPPSGGTGSVVSARFGYESP